MYPTKINLVGQIFSLVFENALWCESILTLLKMGFSGAAHQRRGARRANDETWQLYVT